jgi:signal transduction histidine kinase
VILRQPSLSPSYQPVLLALGFALLVLVGATSIWLVAQADGDSARIVRTLEIKERLGRLQSLIWRAESNQRGFLLTGDDKYREAFRADVDAIEAALPQLQEALGDGKGSLFGQLDAAIAAELGVLEQTAERRERLGLEDLLAAPIGILEESRAEEIRTMIGQLVQQEQGLLVEELATSSRTAHQLLVANLSGVFLILVLAATSIAIVQRSTRRMIAAQEALKEANESLEETVARRTAELRQANEEIQQFAHIVSHDLRSPLVNVMGFTGELEVVRKELFERLSSLRARLEVDSEPDERLAGEFDEALGFIKSSITRMDRLIKAILKLTREGRRELRLEPIEMTELARTAADGFGYQAQEAGASITIEPLPPCVGDRLALEQIFANLMENALKYLRNDTPGQIRVTGQETATEVIYEVHDNGRGIELKDRERIFEIFRRSGLQDRPGEGIGLTYVRTLVRRLGGTIAVDSEPGRGSTFTIALPRLAPGSLSEKSP